MMHAKACLTVVIEHHKKIGLKNKSDFLIIDRCHDEQEQDF